MVVEIRSRIMGEDYFAVYCGEIKLADHMTLGTALLFIEAYVQKYWRDNFVMSLHKVDDESDRYKQDLAKLQECKRQIEFEAYTKGE
jgi:hypothetical protein